MNARFLVVACLLAAPDAFADEFQVYDGNTPYFIAHARILVNRNDVGTTDAYGRIKIALAPGSYVGEVVNGSVHKQVRFTIDNSAQMKKLVAE